MKKKFIILHCSDSEWGDRDVINNWHKQRGWSGIGYHFVILNEKPKYKLTIKALNGSIEQGRNIDTPGAHALGYNHNSIGICLIGKKSFTAEQILSTIRLVSDLMDMYNIPVENVLGHYETPKSNGKTCPNIDMEKFRNKLKLYRNNGICSID